MSSADVCIRSAAPGDAAGLAALARRVFVSPAGCQFYQAYAGGRQRDGDGRPPDDALDSSACFLAATTAVLNGAQLKRDYTLPIAAIFEEIGRLSNRSAPSYCRSLSRLSCLRSDRVVIAYRRWLHQRGLRFGTA
jgi:hypothetical protein